ncbi:putative glycosyl hydrolases family 43 [Lyophyllum shimeji]|uniref:Glycosyl hydrolases family 43 n=1 Tax=Lyophyllum shimeji TaxID=47721 RepID=A0A9P3PPY4_LYOSH|nr:putative glycosyl hydrolases family 43 [Lyophyllum shimeji]
MRFASLLSLLPLVLVGTSLTTGPNELLPRATFANPVLWEDTPDIGIIRVNNTYYYTASSFHLSPGAPILRSYDLINWEFLGHSVPVLDWSSKYNLANGERAYVKGIWASFFDYRKSNGLFYWGGCIEFSQSYIYTAPAVTGPWTKRSTINTCWYDAGLLIDDNDTMYVAYGNTQISVAQLSADGLSVVKSQQVYSSSFTIEGSRFYKRNGQYYIFVTRPADGQFILKSSSPWGPYTINTVIDKTPSPTTVNGGVPHQGGLIETAAGDWYYMAFIDAYPGGRIPALAPVTWSADGWPSVQLVSGRWGSSYTTPNISPAGSVKSPVGTDTFSTISPEWEWNHNPDTTKFSTGSAGLRLSTATVTSDLYAARNTLTHRILGPTSIATIVLDYTSLANGDRAGLALFRDSSAWIGVAKDNGAIRVAYASGITMVDSQWTTSSTGSIQASASIPTTGRIWLRATANVMPGANGKGSFAYSLDGQNFTPLGGQLSFITNWTYFLGYRFAIFNYATIALGGSVTVSSFTLAKA